MKIMASVSGGKDSMAMALMIFQNSYIKGGGSDSE